MWVFIFSVKSILNMLGAFFNVVTWLNLLVLDLVLYLCVPVLSTIMSLFVVFPLLGSHEAGVLVYLLLFFQFSFLAIFLSLGVTAEFFLG